MDKIQLKLKGVSDIYGKENIGVLMLCNLSETLGISILCPKLIKDEVGGRMRKTNLHSLHAIDVLLIYVDRDMLKDHYVLFKSIHNGKYIAELACDDCGEITYDMLGEEAVILAMAAGIPMYITRDLMAKQATPLLHGTGAMALPYNALTEDMLLDVMNTAVEREQYEMASMIRNELNARERADIDQDMESL